MIKKRKPKAPALRDSVQKRIAEFIVKNPEKSRREVSVQFGCTLRQVMYAEERYKRGDFDGRGTKGHIERARSMAKKADVVEIMHEQLALIMTQLQIEDLTATQRAAVLEKFVYMRRHLQAMELESHIKRTDASIIKLIVQKFKPDATDEDVIKIYSEVMELWKHSLR